MQPLAIILDDSSATGTDTDGYESCVGPHGSVLKGASLFMLLDFGKSRRLRIAES